MCPSLARVKPQLLQLAGIHEEIMAMPMIYNSPIGDMGSSLSGGQKTRVLLARALTDCRESFFDEGTAHLNINEGQINQSIKYLQMTRISVAHRPEVSSAADRICELQGLWCGMCTAPHCRYCQLMQRD